MLSETVLRCGKPSKLRSALAILIALGAASVAASALAPAALHAQGLLVNISVDEHVRLPRPIYILPHPHPHPRPTPQPPESYKIKEIEINAALKDQAATVQVTQSFVNTGSRVMQVAFVFPLPPDAAIDRLTLMVDGKEFPGKLLGKEEARRKYEEIVRKNQDPALLEWMGSGMFQTSVFPVPPGAERKVMLRYSQLCRHDQGVTDFLFPLSTAKYTSHPVEKVDVRVTIDSSEDIKSIYSPSHSLEVKRQKNRATVTYTSKNEVPTSDFRLMFDVGKGKLSARVLSYRPKDKDDGYFLLLSTPRIVDADEEPEAKTVVFVVDRSGSMSGEKIVQARDALKFVLNRLRKGDLFNIIAYDDKVESFKPELQRFDDESKSEALGFVESIYAGGSTNINGALTAALEQLKDSSRPNYVLFLTDGLPTAGETSETKIVDNAKSHNRVRARVITFGVGYDVNSRLLDKLARANFGQSEYVRPNEDLEDRVGRLYSKFEAPVLTDAKIEFLRDEPKSAGPVVNRVYPRETFDLFAGEQLVIVGRYKKSGDVKVRVSGRVSGEEQEFAFPGKFAKESSDDTNGFIEKLWATRRIGEIIDELDLKGRNNELVTELVELSTRHGILTPYTSFLADENVRLGDITTNAATSTLRLRELETVDGRGGFEQRALKGAYQNAAAPASAPAASAPFSGGISGAGSFGSSGGSYSGGTNLQGSLRAAPRAGGVPGLAMPSSPAPAAGPTVSGAFNAVADGYDAAAGKPAEAKAGESAPAGSTTGDRLGRRAVVNLGNKSFYWRENQWRDSTVTDEQVKKAERCEQFSPRYFELANRHGRKLSQYLVADEPVMVNLDGEILLIEPPVKN
jgi:Ca-activated chloride channel family protein